MRRFILGLILAVLLAAGCSSDNFRDVEGVPSQDPPKIELFNNVNGHPNLVMVCIHGVAFVTTTRQYEPAQRVPDLDRNCPDSVVQ